MRLSNEKRVQINQLLKVGTSQNQIMKITKCGKSTVQKIRKELAEKQKGRDSSRSDGIDNEFLSIADIDRYVKKCMNNPAIQPNTALLNTGIKLLELKNKIEPEQMKKLKEKERIEFNDTIGEAINYIHTIRPDYQVEVSPKLGSDDKTSEVEG